MNNLKRKIVSIIMICTIIAIIVTGTISVNTANKIISENAVQRMNLLCDYNRLSFNDMLSSIEQSVNILAKYTVLSIDDVDSFKSDPEYVENLENNISDMYITTAKNTKGAVGVYARFNPEFTDPKSGIFLIRNQSKETYVYEDPTDLSKYAADDYGHVGWYYETMKKGEALWMQPYLNRNTNNYLISYIIPIYINDEFIGIVGMDINFLYIVSLVRSISIYDTGYAFLINNNGEIIYHPDIEKGEKLSDYVDIDIVKYINNIHNKRDNESNVHYEYNGKSKYLSIGKLNNNAYLVITAPESEIFADAIVLRQRITLFAEMTAIVVFIIGLLLIKTIEKQTSIDHLTGVKNREAFIREVDEKLKLYRSSSYRPPNYSYAFIMIDIDHFKDINDSMGHNTGDMAIKSVAYALERVFNNNDIIGRFGGDEFLVFVQCIDKEIVEKRINEFMKLIYSGSQYYSYKMTCSSGIIFSSNCDTDSDKLILEADAAMYEAKKLGRGRYILRENN